MSYDNYLTKLVDDYYWEYECKLYNGCTKINEITGVIDDELECQCKLKEEAEAEARYYLNQRD